MHESTFHELTDHHLIHRVGGWTCAPPLYPYHPVITFFLFSSVTSPPLSYVSKIVENKNLVLVFKK